jgi:hypothetical protein
MHLLSAIYLSHVDGQVRKDYDQKNALQISASRNYTIVEAENASDRDASALQVRRPEHFIQINAHTE